MLPSIRDLEARCSSGLQAESMKERGQTNHNMKEKDDGTILEFFTVYVVIKNFSFVIILFGRFGEKFSILWRGNFEKR